MKHLKNFNSFLLVEKADRRNFNIILTSLYRNHLSINEQMLIKEEYGMINESWFSDLADKAGREVLKVTTAEGQILVDLAKKAKEVLDFAKQLAFKISDYLKKTFPNFTSKIKNKVLSDNDFIKSLTEFLDKKDPTSLKRGLQSVVTLVKYITSGNFYIKLTERITDSFSKILSFDRNEGVNYIFEQENNEEKKSFLEKLGEMIMKLPPFSWIPKIEELLKKGIFFVAKLVDRFFLWIQYGEEIKLNEDIDLTRTKKNYGSFKRGYGRGIYFLFQILEIYVFYKINGKVGWAKKLLDPSKQFSKDDGDNMSDTEVWSNEIKNKKMEDIWNYVGLNPADVISNTKNIIKSIPFIGDFITIIDMLFVGIGIYLALEPTLKKLST